MYLIRGRITALYVRKGIYCMEEIEEFDQLKTQVLKYALYKKRSEAEVKIFQKHWKNVR